MTNPDLNNAFGEMEKPVEARPVPPKKPSAWRVIVYMSADADNLQRPLQADLAELLRPLREVPAGQTRPHILVEIETPSGLHKRCTLADDDHIEWLDAGPKTDNPIVALVLAARARWPRSKYDALILWGHSAGAGTSLKVPEGPAEVWRSYTMQLGCVTRNLPPSRTFFWYEKDIDTVAAKIFELDPELKEAMQGSAAVGKKVDLLLADTCFLGGLEWALGLRKLASWMLATQGTIAFESLPFDVLMEAIITEDETEPKDLGLQLVDQVDVFRKSPAALALYDLDRALAVRDALDELVERLKQAMNGEATSRLNWPINGYAPKLRVADIVQACAWTTVRQFIDLTDLALRLASQGTGHAIRDAARVLLRQLDLFMLDRATKGAAPLGGISIFCPWVRATDRETAAGARNLDLDEKTYDKFEDLKAWCDFVFEPTRLQEAHQRNLRREIREQVHVVRSELANRDTKPAGMDTKPSGMDTKPSGMITKPMYMGLGLDPS